MAQKNDKSTRVRQTITVTSDIMYGPVYSIKCDCGDQYRGVSYTMYPFLYIVFAVYIVDEPIPPGDMMDEEIKTGEVK